MSAAQIYFSIFIMALVTYVIRVIPMAFFSRPIHSEFFQSFLYYVPYAVLTAMTFPAVFTSSGLSSMICAVGVLAAIVCAWYGGSLLLVAAVSAAAAWIAQTLL